MIKSTRIVKIILALFLVVLMSIESFGAVVSDNDGSAFITKAEFDSLKNNFQSQIDQYNTSIDSKIDGAIAQYLAGINVEKISTERLMLWGGRTLGLLENTKSRPYKEGTVGGKIEYSLWASYINSSYTNYWYNGYNSSSQTSGSFLPRFFAYCHHIFSANAEPFSYCLVQPNDNNYNLFDFIGYASVLDTIAVSSWVRTTEDYTLSGRFLFGFCNGIYPIRFALNQVLSSQNTPMISVCESVDTLSWARGSSRGSSHNIATFNASDGNYTTNFNVMSDYAYLTNTGATDTIKGLRDIEWHGINLTNDDDEAHTYGEFAKQGWTIPTNNVLKNFHIKASNDLSGGSSGRTDVMYGCYSITWPRGVAGDGSGASYTHDSGSGHGRVPSTDNFKKLFKADIGDAVNGANIYSSEIGNVISDDMPDKVTTDVFDGVSKTVAPLSIGLPIATVKENDSVKLELDFLNAADYTVAFAVGGFDTEPIANTIGIDTGCVVKGSTNHMISFTGPRTAEPIIVNVNKDGILFLKYSATGDNAQQIKLPVNCVITTNG